MSVCNRIVWVVSAGVLAGCASPSPRPSGGTMATASVASAQGAERIGIDERYVSEVNRTARQRGLVVQWFNPPLRRRVDESGASNPRR